jgi:ArsR family transcriptional regulator, arsenate/arsenite/antimonite-responsive transcriptional repressor
VLCHPLREDQSVPKYARPAGGEGAEAAISVFGNYVKAAAIRYLREHPNVTRKSIAEALELPPTTFVAYLGELEEAGLILADPPRAQRRKGEWPVYRVNDAEVTALYLRLGQELGEI